MLIRLPPDKPGKAEMENTANVYAQSAHTHWFHRRRSEVHQTQNGTLVAVISVATKESWKDADGEWQSRTDWHRVVSFGKLAEYTRTLAKGSYVMVQGTVRSREFERDGVRQHVTEVRADLVGKLDRAERAADRDRDSDPNEA